MLHHSPKFKEQEKQRQTELSKGMCSQSYKHQVSLEYRIAGKSRWKKMYCYKKLTDQNFVEGHVREIKNTFNYLVRGLIVAAITFIKSVDSCNWRKT